MSAKEVTRCVAGFGGSIAVRRFQNPSKLWKPTISPGLLTNIAPIFPETLMASAFQGKSTPKLNLPRNALCESISRHCRRK
jgi:hypothetical protein